RGEGVEDVYHLKGGILKYLEEVPEAESTWEGGCFVFDRRVSVTHGLAEGPHVLCHACRRPLAPKDLTRPEYVEGSRCHHCVDEYTEADRTRFRQRHYQRAIGGHD
ncbi:MAG: rhodanese-related sulfurtransferase, partial [Shimia sp.]